MTGRAVERLETVVTKRTNGILLMSSQELRISQPVACIRCGWCVEDCPVGLNPAELTDVAQRRRFDRAASLFAHACIECGLCTYVCPSQLPLADAARVVKTKVALSGHQRMAHV